MSNPAQQTFTFSKEPPTGNSMSPESVSKNDLALYELENDKNAPWVEQTLEAVGIIYSGATPSTSVRAFWDGDIVWITPYDLSRLSTPLLTDSARRITHKGLKGCSAHLLPPQCVVLSSRAPIGYLAIPKVPFCTNQGCKSIKPKDGIVNEFLYYNLLFNLNKLKNLGEGTTFAEISKTALSSVSLSFPTLKTEQTKIAEILSAIDRAIEQTEALIAKQQRIKLGLMRDLLARGIDEHGNIRTPSTHPFKNSPLGPVPQEWEVKTLDELTLRIVDGVHHTPEYQEEGIPFIVITDLTRGGIIDFMNTRFISHQAHRSYSKRADPKPGDVLVTKDGTLGIARIVPSDVPEFSIFVSVAMLRPRTSRCTSELIWSFFDSGEFLQQLGAKSAGTGLAHIHLEHFRSFLLRVPPVEEQRAIFQFISSYAKSLAEAIKSLQKLRSLKTALMQDLLTCRRRVTPLLSSAPTQ